MVEGNCGMELWNGIVYRVIDHFFHESGILRSPNPEGPQSL